MTMTREKYKQKFDELFGKKFNYIMEPGEKIVQCHDPYPSYWFISNMAKLFSVYFKDVKMVKLNPRKTGKNKTGQNWFVRPFSHGKPVNIQNIVAEHFLETEFPEYSSEAYEIHHIKKVMSFNENESQKANRANNLQILPHDTIHNALTQMGSHTVEEQMKKFEEEAKKAPVEIKMTKEQMMELLKKAVEQNDDAYMLIQTINDENLKEVETYAKKIK